MIAVIPDGLTPRLGQLVRLLASNHDGEVLGAARAIGRTLASVGLSLHDLADRIEHPSQIVSSPSSARRSRKKRSESKSSDVHDGILLDEARRTEVIKLLEEGCLNKTFSYWEYNFASSIIDILRSNRNRLSDRQYEIVERLLSKRGEG